MKKNEVITAVLVLVLFTIFPTLGVIVLLVFLFSIFTKNKSKPTFLRGIIRPKAVSKLIKCTDCGTEAQEGDKFCKKCGKKITAKSKVVNSMNYDPMFRLDEDEMLKQFIIKEMEKANLNVKDKLIPQDIKTRKNILNIIFSILLFVYISLIFFHFPIITYILGLIVLIVFLIMSNKYNIYKYLIKEVKARPNEKISNIIMNAKTSLVSDNSLLFRLTCIVIAIGIPLLLFQNPRIMYEKVEGGYGVRFYIYGLKNYTTATIPAKHNGEDVVTLRGNTFSNMHFLKEVILPDNIKEIRGQAFKNCTSLKRVNMPSKLEYLGGGAFRNCKSLESISFPDSVTYIGGESFYGASNLKEVRLSEHLTEIRGDTFEYCTSLESIKIPDSVTRIGGHAFYGDSKLQEVIISDKSGLQEIGSSAFRLCTSLNETTIPRETYVNERAFKESPTTIKYHGYESYNNDNLKNNYKYNTYLFLQEHEKDEINHYISDAIIQNSYIELKEVKNENGEIIYIIEYSDTNGAQQYTITKNNLEVTVNENLVIKAEDYVFDDLNRTYLTLDVYYN